MPDVASQAKFSASHAAKHASATPISARPNRAETPDSAFADMLDSAAAQPKPEPKAESKPRANEADRRDTARVTDKPGAAAQGDDKVEANPAETTDSETASACEAAPAEAVKIEVEAAPQLLQVQVKAEVAEDSDDKASTEKADTQADAAVLALPVIPVPDKPVEIAAAIQPVAVPAAEVKGATPELAAPQAQPAQVTAPAPSMPEAPVSAEPLAKPHAAEGKPQFHVEAADKPAAPATVEAQAARTATASAETAPDVANASQPATQPSNTPHAAQPVHLNAPAAQTAAAPTTTASPSVNTTPVPLHAVAVEIAARATSGNKRFDIRLDPPELGKIDVRLDIDRHGQVTSRLIVEKAETLDLLRRDAPQLERALQDAGLKTSNEGLQFSLQQQMTQQDDDNGGRLTGTAQLAIVDETIAPDIVQRGYAQLAAARGGIDIRI